MGLLSLAWQQVAVEKFGLGGEGGQVLTPGGDCGDPGSPQQVVGSCLKLGEKFTGRERTSPEPQVP